MPLLMQMIGASAVTKMFKSAAQDAPHPWHVYQADVDYDIYHELGTASFGARPHWRPGVLEAEAAIDELAMKAHSVQDLIRLVAFRVEANVKKIIQEKEIIDTGDLMRGVQAEEMK